MSTAQGEPEARGEVTKRMALDELEVAAREHAANRALHAADPALAKELGYVPPPPLRSKHRVLLAGQSLVRQDYAARHSTYMAHTLPGFCWCGRT